MKLVKRNQKLHNPNSPLPIGEVKEGDFSSNDVYSAASAVAYMKINEGKEIYKICRSTGNNDQEFADLFAVIYRSGNYYKVVVPNVMISTKDINKATFVYNWWRNERA